MKKLLRKLTAVVSAAAVAIAGVNFGALNLFAWAESDGIQTRLDVSQGNIVITDDSVTVKDSGGTDVGTYTVDEDGYVITGTTEQYTVTVSGTQNITLDGVNINVSATKYACAFKITDDNTGDVTITLADDSVNTLSSGYKCAGLQKNGDGADIGKLTIQGGTNGTGELTLKRKRQFWCRHRRRRRRFHFKH